MPYATAAGPVVGATWRTIRVLSDADGAPLRRAGALVVEDASNADLVQTGRPRVYYALPGVPAVALDADRRPVLSLVLMLSRSPGVDEDSVHHLIQQSVLDCDLSLELSRGALDALARSRELAAGSAAADVRPLFVRDARFTLRPAPTASSGVSSTAIATARSTGGAAARASLQATLNREQTLGLLAALDGAPSNLALTTEVTYRVSGMARRRLSGDWAAVHDYISPRLPASDSIARGELRALFDEMLTARILSTSVSPAGGHAQQADEGSVPRAASGMPPPAKRGESRTGGSIASARASVRTAPAGSASNTGNDSASLFDAFIRQSIVILKRLTPDLASTDPGNCTRCAQGRVWASGSSTRKSIRATHSRP